MGEHTLTHDVGVAAFEDASGVVDSDGDGVTFSWDERNVVHVDAPADLEGAFDTERFYKIEGATIARPIKQPYMVGDEVKWYKKPTEELEKAAWSFDNAPFTLGHPESGMVKNVDDIHGFWRNPRYDSDDERLKEDLYVPANDDEALQFIEDNSDVSVGFYNRVHSDYGGNTGDLTDDDVDGFQVDMYGNHVAGVERGRCSAEHGCGLDDETGHGTVFANSNDVDSALSPSQTMTDSCCGPTTDAPSGIYVEDGNWFGVAPSETSDDEPKYDLNNCNDVKDAWNLRGSGDYDIEQSTLEQRIKRAAESHDCPSEQRPWDDQTEDSNMGDSNDDDNGGTNDGGFDIPDLSVDAIAEQHDAIADLREERDEYQDALETRRERIDEAIDAAENFSIELEEDECRCDSVEVIVADLDQKIEEVTDLRDELSEYREDEIEERLDELAELGADRDEWEETADEADDPLDVLDEEIQRREEVLDATDGTTVKNVDSGNESNDSDETNTTISGTRTFGRGHNA